MRGEVTCPKPHGKRGIQPTLNPSLPHKSTHRLPTDPTAFYGFEVVETINFPSRLFILPLNNPVPHPHTEGDASRAVVSAVRGNGCVRAEKEDVWAIVNELVSLILPSWAGRMALMSAGPGLSEDQ